MTCLIIPGLGSSGPDHWQSHWERHRSDCRRVELGDWDDPDRAGWTAALGRTLDRLRGTPVLVAHSLGCHAVTSWADRAPGAATKIAGALLVAPPDIERADADPRLRRFAPTVRSTLPFPAIVVASRDDPYATFPRSAEMAAFWGAAFEDAGVAGHLNAASGLGDWEHGRRLVARLIATTATVPAPRRASLAR